ncbi:MAG: hypothetical protein M3P52_00440, partial [Actinomycetota bacterium]|nr:hypothetical protein [Actinomycetota bacterium]
MSDQEFAQTEALLRRRLAQLADHAPAAVHLPDEVPVLASNGTVRHRRRRVGVIAAVTALVGAGGFTTYSFLGTANDGGAATPEEAVSAFVSAMEQEDVLGMIDVALPEEVGALRSAVDSATADAKRLDLLGDEFDSNGVQGIDVSIDDLALDTNFLEGGLAIVTAAGGTVSASFDPNTFAFGEKVRELLDGGQQAGTASAGLGDTDPPALLMTVERDGRWYVSLEYTAAEYMRRAAGWELPGPVSRTAVGFDSPEEAVTGFFDRLGALDLQAAIDTFAPGEDAMAWLAPMWIPDAQAAIAQGRSEGWSVAISGLTYETIGDGDHRTLKPLTFTVEGTVPADYNAESSSDADPSWPTVVVTGGGAEYTLVPPGQVPATIDGLTFSATFPEVDGPYNFTFAQSDGTIIPLVFATEPTGRPRPFTVTRTGGCSTYAGEGAQSMFGFSTSLLAEPVEGGYQLCGPGLVSGLSLVLGGGGLAELPAVSVVHSGGRWYVSPLGTVLATVSTSLHDVKDGSSLFDSALAPYIYGGLSRSYLESVVTGQAVDSIDPACLAALSVENGAVTGVIADPAVDAVRACGFTAAFGGEVTSSGGGFTVAP